MGNLKTKIVIYVTAFLAVFAVSFAFSPKAEARNPVATQVSADGFRVGGEPGEDPHLKVLPTKTEEDANPLGSYSGPVSAAPTVTTGDAMGLREGTEVYVGSRVNIAWRMILEAWLWTMHR